MIERDLALTHYRETRGAEVDLVVTSTGSTTLVEVKSGATGATDWFGPLRDLLSRSPGRSGRRRGSPGAVEMTTVSLPGTTADRRLRSGPPSAVRRLFDRLRAVRALRSVAELGQDARVLNR